jgi:hypothetical protein
MSTPSSGPTRFSTRSQAARTSLLAGPLPSFAAAELRAACSALDYILSDDCVIARSAVRDKAIPEQLGARRAASRSLH